MDQAPSTSSEPRFAGQLDLYAAAMATLCLLHCLALPILLATLPLSLFVIDNHWFHQLIVVLAAPATLWIIYSARPGRLFTVAAVCGLALLLIGAFVETLEIYEEPLTIAGSILLGSAHLTRWLRHRRAAAATGEAPAAEHETPAGAELK